MLVRLIYASRAAEALTAEGLSSMMKEARDHHAGAGITGVLVYSEGIFLQLVTYGVA